MVNPIANAGQFAAEEEVRFMWERAETRLARAHCAQLWRVGHGRDVPPDVEPHFESAMDGWISNYLFKAAAMDPWYPRFVRNFMPGYTWQGRAVPDARMGGDNPDNCYRLAGIRHGGRYRVTGTLPDAAPAHVSFTLVENWGTSRTVQTLEFPGIVVGADRQFTITIDATPAQGRGNHMTTNPRTKFLYVRDSMQDWARERPVALAIACLDADGKQPMAPEQRLDEALRRAREDVPLYYWFFRLSAGKPVNSLAEPMGVGGFGGLRTQASAIGYLHLEDEQAAVIRFPRAGAAYCSLQMAMWWYRSIDAHQIQSGLNVAQMSVDADGWYTAVISARNPGVGNWVETGGFHDLLPMIRWQGLPHVPVEGGPLRELHIVPLADIERYVPPSTVRIAPAERAARLEARRTAWGRRIQL